MATIDLALGKLSVRVITIDEVIASKEKLGRPKDTGALPALYATREALQQRGANRRAGLSPGPFGSLLNPA